MKQQAANIYIGLVAALGLIVLIASSINIRASAIDPIMFVFILALVGIAQRNPVVLFRSSAISVAFAVKIAAYVLFGTPLALWATIVVVAVNAYTPKPKPARKVLFNFGQLMLATYLASSTYQLVGGMVPPGAFVPTMLAVAVSAAVYFVANSALTASVISLTSSARFVDVWMQNFAWMPVNYLATAVNGAALALAYQSLGFIGVIVFVLPLGIAWYSFKLYTMKSTQLRERNRERDAGRAAAGADVDDRTRDAAEDLNRAQRIVQQHRASLHGLAQRGQAGRRDDRGEPVSQQGGRRRTDSAPSPPRTSARPRAPSASGARPSARPQSSARARRARRSRAPAGRTARPAPRG